MTSRDPTGPKAGDPGSVETWLVSAGRDRHPGSPLNVPPIPASNFVLGERRAYSRDDGTPGWEALEEIVGGLEGGLSVSFGSGMAGIAAIFDQVPAGSIVAIPDDCYQGVAGLAQAGQSRGRWTVHRVAVADTARWVEKCSVADLIWLESPSNPLLTVGDLDTICAAPRKRGAILGVDNTFATPLNQRPLALGADVAVQSVTKFIGGHSDQLHASGRRAPPRRWRTTDRPTPRDPLTAGPMRATATSAPSMRVSRHRDRVDGDKTSPATFGTALESDRAMSGPAIRPQRRSAFSVQR